MKKWLPVVSVAVLGVASGASASTPIESASCSKNTDGSGSCTGSLLGFRNHSAASTYARFYKHATGAKSFTAAYTPSSGTVTYYSCTPDAAVAAIWDRAMRHRAYFSISWNADGTCTSLYLSNNTQYANY